MAEINAHADVVRPKSLVFTVVIAVLRYFNNNMFVACQ